MKIFTIILTTLTLLPTTHAFAPPSTTNTIITTHNNNHRLTNVKLSNSRTLPQENGAWESYHNHPDTRHTILPQELGVWSTSPPPGYVPPPTVHLDTRKKILDQEGKGVWPTSPPPGWVCPKPEGCCAEDIREAWISYAPFNTKNGRVGSLGYVGCPGGGDWCYASNGPASTNAPLSSSASSGGNSQAQSVAAALAGLGNSGRPNVRDRVKKSYGIGSWKK
eukprot:scaffold392678_cov76-Cyclotella_meneghiniana.AAC.2